MTLDKNFLLGPKTVLRIHLKSKIPHTLVRKGASIEARNKYIQSVFHRLVRLKRGNTHTLVPQTQKIVNNTRNRIHHNKTPLQLVNEQVSETLSKFNKKRASLDPVKRKPFKIGDTVRILLARRDKETKLDFKAYKGKSYSKIIYRIQGITKKHPVRYRLKVNEKHIWFTQDNLIRTPRFDKKTDEELAKLTTYGFVSKTDKEKKERAKELLEKKKILKKQDKEKYTKKGRRSSRRRIKKDLRWKY